MARLELESPRAPPNHSAIASPNASPKSGSYVAMILFVAIPSLFLLFYYWGGDFCVAPAFSAKLHISFPSLPLSNLLPSGSTNLSSLIIIVLLYKQFRSTLACASHLLSLILQCFLYHSTRVDRFHIFFMTYLLSNLPSRLLFSVNSAFFQSFPLFSQMRFFTLYLPKCFAASYVLLRLCFTPSASPLCLSSP